MAERTYGGDFQQESCVSGSMVNEGYFDADGNSDVTNVFKTPGKLKGKTPRTARKRNVAEARIVSQIHER